MRVREACQAWLLLSIVVANASAEPVVITHGTVDFFETHSEWSLGGEGLTLNFSVDDLVAYFPCGSEPCKAGQSVSVHPALLDHGSALGGVVDYPPPAATFEGRQVNGAATITVLDAPSRVLPSESSPFSLTSAFFATGDLLIVENLQLFQLPFVGRGTASMQFVPDASRPSTYWLKHVQLRFGEAAPVPEPASLLLLSVGLLGVAARRRLGSETSSWLDASQPPRFSPEGAFGGDNKDASNPWAKAQAD